MEYQNYDNVPLYRKSGTNSLLVLIGLFIPPFIWAVAFATKKTCFNHMKTLIVFVNAIMALTGLLLFNWNPFVLLLIYIYESLFLSLLTIYTIKRSGGNNLLYNLLPIDKEFYNKKQLTKTKKSNPFLTFSSSLIIYNFIIIASVYKIVNFSDPKIILLILLPFAGVTINYLINNKNFLPLNSKKRLTSYLSNPVKSIFTMHFGLIIGMILFDIFSFSAFMIIGIILLRLAMDLALKKHNSAEFNIKILNFFGIKMSIEQI